MGCNGCHQKQVEPQIDEVLPDLHSSLQQITKQLYNVQKSLKTKGRATQQSPSPTPSKQQSKVPITQSTNQAMVDSDDEPLLCAYATHTRVSYKKYTP